MIIKINLKRDKNKKSRGGEERTNLARIIVDHNKNFREKI
jgi:hypothetical protein